MSYTKDSPQHRRIARIPSGGTVHNSTSAVTVSSQGAHASISSLPKTLGGVGLDYRTKDVQSLENGLYRWQVSGAGSSKWPNNSSDSSVPYGSPALDTISAAYSEILDSSIRSADGGQAQRFFGGKGQFSTAVASVLSGGSPEFGFNASPSVGAAALASNASSLSFQGWNSTRDRSNLSLAVDPSKGGFALQGAAAATGRSPTTSAAQTTARFSTNPRFAERAARFSALANGSYSLSSFPLTETENGGRSPAENDCTGGSGREAAVPSSGGGPPRRSDLGQDCSMRIPVAAYHNVSEDRRAVYDGGKENLERTEETKAVAATTGRTRSDWDGTDQRGGRNAEEQERFLSDSEESESSRGEQQEASRGDELGAACLDRSAALVRKKRNFFSSEQHHQQQHGKESSNGSKERKVGLDGPSKRCKDGKRGAEKDELKEKAEWSSSSRGHSSPSSPAAASKDVARNVEQQPKLDYIHVRARRGQATDSHSLAERVRREKISERMKYLQDLVPGCSKVTGKAGMLDEIINYVQSIQRQVEFLSMKLAAVTPRPDFNPDSILSKHLQMGSAYGHSVVEHSENNLPLTQAETQQALHVPQEGATTPDFQPAVDISVRRMNEARVLLPKNPLPVFHTGGPFQASSRWDGDLQSVVQMGLSQGNHGYRQTGYHSFSPGSMILE